MVVICVVAVGLVFAVVVVMGRRIGGPSKNDKFYSRTNTLNLPGYLNPSVRRERKGSSMFDFALTVVPWYWTYCTVTGWRRCSVVEISSSGVLIIVVGLLVVVTFSVVRTIFVGFVVDFDLAASHCSQLIATGRVVVDGPVQFSAVQCSAVQCSAGKCNGLQCSAVQCSAVQCSAVQCSAMQCNAVQCSAMQCNAVQCHAVQCSDLLLLYLKR